ncbi:MAG: N-acetylmuramoyl-L-alanine amidase [Hyphomicrobiaceae bacterium]
MHAMPDTTHVANIHASPNVEPRRDGVRPDILLLHYTGMFSCAKAIDWLSRPEAKVSCHYVVDCDGTITQMVPEALRAWHAGVGVWHGETDINSRSIGIEIHNPGHDQGYPDFPPVQMEAVAVLSADIVARHRIAPERVLAHSDVAPARKIDPGEKFDWAWLAARGVGHWVCPAAITHADQGPAAGTASPGIRTAQALLARYGYGIPATGVLDEETMTVLRAFQRHFRPARVDGRLDASTAETLARLVASLPGATASA